MEDAGSNPAMAAKYTLYFSKQMEGTIHKTSLCWHIITDDFYDERFRNNGFPIAKYQWRLLNESYIGEKVNFELENV